MKKEAIIAIILGVILGTILSFFLIQKNKKIELVNQKKIAPTEKLSLEKKVVSDNFQPLEIIKPLNNAIVGKSEVTIELKLTKNSLVIIQSPIKDIASMVDKPEASFNLPLTLGENVVRIGVYPKDKKIASQEKEIKIYYLENEI